VLDRPQHLHALAEGRDRLLAGARAAGPSVVVPTAHRWTVRDLVVHAGNVHDWAADILRTRVEQPQVFDAQPVGIGDSFDELLFWYAARAGALLDLLLGDQVPDDTAVWTFGPPGTAAFWPRRQAHEATMHALDATLAAGEPVADALLPLDPVLSADGVDEVLTVMLPRVASFVPRPSMPGGLLIVATDTGDRWELQPDGQIASAATDHETDANLTTLSGPASGLFAMVWRRAFLDADGAELGVGVTGDRAVVDALFAARLTP
jgi:uncharacterized protein (TIGR03083 family)